MNFTTGKVRHAYNLTIACEFASRTLKIKNDKVKIQIWDTAGTEKFRSITRTYYRNTIGAMIVYDITK